MPHKYKDLLGIEIVTLFALFFVCIGWNNGIIGILFGLPFALIIPGYVLSQALLPLGSRDPVERVLLTLSISITVDILGGLLLNVLPWGLQAKTWIILLSLVTFLSCAIAWRRRNNDTPTLSLSIKLQGNLLQVAICLLAIGFVGLSLLFSSQGVKNQPTPGFTQLWALPVASNDTTGTIQIGVRNMEKTTQIYNVKVLINDKLAHEYLGRTIQFEQSWQETLLVSLQKKQTHIEIDLYLETQPDKVYRSVNLWLGGLSS
jgi:uncharacterized membrane protein